MKTLGAHPLGQRPSVCRESSDSYGNVRIDANNFLLMRREFGDGAFECSNDGVSGGAKTDACGSLLDGFHCVFDLEETAFGTPDGDIGIVLISKHDDEGGAMSVKNK